VDGGAADAGFGGGFCDGESGGEEAEDFGFGDGERWNLFRHRGPFGRTVEGGRRESPPTDLGGKDEDQGDV
jgi:hypothetical protein